VRWGRAETWTMPRVRAAAAVAGALLFVLLWVLGLGAHLEVALKPPPPRAEPIDPAHLSRRLDASAAAYAGYLQRDASTYGVDPISPDAMGRPLHHSLDGVARELTDSGPGAVTEVAGLRLSARVEVTGAPRPTLALRIENLRSVPMAYRIRTEPVPAPHRCREKEVLSHNAVAIAGGGTEVRSECIQTSQGRLRIVEVETLALSPLGYHYVSRVDPAQLGLDPRKLEVPGRKRLEIDFGQPIREIIA